MAGIRLFSLIAALSMHAFGLPTSGSLQLHESRVQVPTGFKLNGSPPADTLLNLRIALTQSDPAGLQSALYDVSTPSSANYGKHLSKSEVEQFVAPKPETMEAINTWLSENNITAKTLSPAGEWLGISIPVSKANELFGTEFSAYTREDDGMTTIRTLAYSIPASLKGHIDLVHPTTTFPTRSSRLGHVIPKAPFENSRRASEASSTDIPASCASTITPACLQAIYNIPTTPATSSSNQLAVTGFEFQFANQADLQTFLTDFRSDMPSTTSFTLVSVDGGINNQSSPAGVEANLDIQYAVGIATNVSTFFVSTGITSPDGFVGDLIDAMTFLANEDYPPQVVSTSYGINEPDVSVALADNLCNAIAQLGARGTSVLFASGDQGVAGGQPVGNCVDFVPAFPSGCPFITSVGSTSGINPETAAPFSSGGFSNYFGTPSYQSDAVSAYLSALGTTNAGLFNQSGRAFPDVSAQGVDFEIVVDGGLLEVDGTSCSSPTFAAVIALVNDRLIAAGKSPLGFLNPFLYSNGVAALNDITSGSNPGCNTTGFPALAGWDPVTGLGTPDFQKLLTALNSARSLHPEMASLIANSARARILAARALKPRYLSSSLRRQAPEAENAPKPPPPIDDSTSALDYKRALRHRPPPLPAMDLPRSRTAEEAVTNILYNTPPPSLQPFKKHVLNCLVQNEPGVLSRVSGILAGRGFNIDSLVVCRTEIRDLSRMSIVLRGQDGVVEQARRQLEDLVPVWAVLDYTDTHCIERELLLAKVSILGPEYLEEQLLGGPTHEPRRSTLPSISTAVKLEREMALAQQFEQSGLPESEVSIQNHSPAPLTPSQALRIKCDYMQALTVLSAQFGARIVDVSEHTVIVEMCGKTSRVEAFLSLLKPFGVLEAARTGLMVMPRTPIHMAEEDAEDAEGGVVDASLLPPG
ncbi:Tripeptidyl-peptidase sed3 [Grifola frondosa]|uniref:tripeptidyl-peptidase II n=1 Tax=Grifola frondosa TaxID=5627 RepID=A0A1C7LRR3_GRIFR|nr:Tripeptidyl-peptidase sed3 [Grifola frondosa]